jgi:two-component system chemotaxis response regulator CheB
VLVTVPLVVIGASWGGLAALGEVLGALPAGFPAAVAVVQHRSERDGMLADLLGDAGALAVREAEDKDELRAGEVLVGPPGYHLLIGGDEVALSVDDPVRFSRPSIDVFFESAAGRPGRIAGVVLTGANADGAQGLAEIRRRGGIAIVQDPEDAERSEMPRAALAAVPDALVRPLREIGPELVRIFAGGPA